LFPADGDDFRRTGCLVFGGKQQLENKYINLSSCSPNTLAISLATEGFSAIINSFLRL
jgi:hypothetical protein